MSRLLTLVSVVFLLSVAVFAQPNTCKKWYVAQRTPLAAVQQNIRIYKKLIAGLQQKSPSDVNADFFEDSWSCTTGSCMSMSAQIQSALASYEMPIERVAVSTLLKLKQPGIPDGVYHFFAIDRSIKNQEIIIDPTYKQFFSGEIPEPDIFVGTRAELEAIFIRYHSQVRLQDGSNPLLFDPKGIAEAYYGYGRGEKTKYNSSSRSFYYLK